MVHRAISNPQNVIMAPDYLLVRWKGEPPVIVRFGDDYFRHDWREVKDWNRYVILNLTEDTLSEDTRFWDTKIRIDSLWVRIINSMTQPKSDSDLDEVCEHFTKKMGRKVSHQTDGDGHIVHFFIERENV